MFSKIIDIFKFRKLMNIDPQGEEVDKKEFDSILFSWPKAKTYNYSNATIWKSPWMGKIKSIAMYHLDTEKYYRL